MLELLKKKRVNINRLAQIIEHNMPWYRYNFMEDTSRHLTEEEFNKLRKWWLK